MKRRAMLLATTAAVVFAVPAAGQAQSGLMNVGEVQLRYDVAGAGQPIVFINGWTQELDVWDAQAAALSSRYRIVRYDARGFGGSSGSADVSADVDDLRILLDSLGIRRAHVVGLSRGAGVALEFAVAFPERVSALVLEGATPPVDFQPLPAERPLDTFRRIAREYGMDSVRKAVLASPLAWMPPDHPELTLAVQQGLQRYSGRDLLEPVKESKRREFATLARVSRLRVPTLIVSGDHELPFLKAVADTLARRIPNARKVIIREGGHGAHLAQPDQFNRVLESFFTSLQP